MTSVEKRRSGRKSGGHRKHSDGGYSDTSSAGSFLDETDREVSNLTDRAFRSLCIGDEAVYNDSDLGASSPCTQRDRQLAFSQSGQDRDREREELKRAAHESFSLRMQQYEQDWIHGGMYGAEIQRDPHWEDYGERTQGRVSATFQHSFVETSQQEEALRGEQLSFLSNGATEVSSQQRRSRSRVSSLIRAFNSEGHRDGAGMDNKLREWNDDTSWDKSALMSIQRELSEFSTSYQENFNSGHFPSAGPFASRDTNFYSSEVAEATHMNSGSAFMRSSHSKHSMTAQVNCNSNFFIHSEFSPFKVWRNHNRFPFQQGEVSGFMHYPEFPKWYETPMYKELSLEAQSHYPYRFQERGMRHPKNNMAPVVPSTHPRSTSTSTMLQKAPSVEKRCDSELAGYYPHRKRTQSLGANRLTSQRPSTASPTIEMSRRVQDTISSVRALQQKIKMMTEHNITEGMTANQQGALYSNDNPISFGNSAQTTAPNVVSSNTSTTPFNISQLLTPSVTAHQEAETSEARQFAVSPQPVEHPPVRAESRGATPDIRMSSYKSRATSLLFNLKDNRKRVKSTYSPTKFKGLETPEKNKQPFIQEPRDTVIDMPDFTDADVQYPQVEESSWTNAASHQYVNPYHETHHPEPATAHTGPYSEYSSSDYQTAQMQGEMVHHSGFTGFIPENYTTNQLANGQNLHEDLSSFTPYKQSMTDNVEALGGDTYRLHPSYTATEMPKLNADNYQNREFLPSKANTEQHFNETARWEFPNVDRYQQFKDNNYDYSNVSSQDRWRQTNSQDTKTRSLNAALSPWKQEITALMEKDQHPQAYQRAAVTQEELRLPSDRCRREDLQMPTNGAGASYKKDELVNPYISNQLAPPAPFSNATEENPAYYGLQPPEAFEDKYVLQKQSRHNKDTEMKDDYTSQTFKRYDQEYRYQHSHYSNKDKTLFTQEPGQRKQYTPIPNGYEMQSQQPIEAKPQFENNTQKNNPDKSSDLTMENRAKDRKPDEVKSEQAVAECIKAQHAQAELAKAQRWAQEQPPEVESARLNLAGQTGSEKVKAEEASAQLSEHEIVNQARAEHVKEDDLREEQTHAEQTIVQRVTLEPSTITEEAEAKHIKGKQDEQVMVEQVKAERFKEVKTELAETEQAALTRIKQSKTEQARKERIKAEQLEEEKVKAEQVEREWVEAEQIRLEKVKAEQAEAERRKAEQAELQRIKEQAKAEQEKPKVVEKETVQAARVNEVKPTATKNKEDKVKERKEANSEQTKVKQTSTDLKILSMPEWSAKPVPKLTVTQHVKSERDKVEQVKTELAKAKAELAKIKEKMRGEQKHKVRNTGLTTDGEIKRDVPVRVNTNKNEENKDQDQATKMQQPCEDLADACSQSTDQANSGVHEYTRLREKYGFIDTTPSIRNKLSATGNVSSSDANETPSLDKSDTKNDDKSKDKHSPTIKLATVTTEHKEEISLKSSDVTESQYIYSESSKEFKLSSGNFIPTNVEHRANSGTVTERVKEDRVEKLEKCDPHIQSDVSLKKDSDSVIPVPPERKPRPSEHSVGPGKDKHSTPHRGLSHKEKAQTKQEILTSKIKAHAEKEISAIRDGFISKSSTKQLGGSQSTNVRQRPLSQEVPKKPDSTISTNIAPKNQMEPSGIQIEQVKSVSPSSSTKIQMKSAATTSQLVDHSQKVPKEPTHNSVPKPPTEPQQTGSYPMSTGDGLVEHQKKSVSPSTSAKIPMKSAAKTTQLVDHSQKVPKEPTHDNVPKPAKEPQQTGSYPMSTGDGLVEHQKRDNQSGIQSPMQSKEQAPKNKQGKRESNHGESSGKQTDGLKDSCAVDTDDVNKDKAATHLVQVKSSKPTTTEEAESKHEPVVEDSAPTLNFAFGQSKTSEADDSLQITGIMVIVRERQPPVSNSQVNDSTQEQLNAKKEESRNSDKDKCHPSSERKGNESSKEVSSVETKDRVVQNTHTTVKDDPTEVGMNIHTEKVQEAFTEETSQNNVSKNVSVLKTDVRQESSNTDTRPQRETQLQEVVAEKGLPSTVSVPAKNKSLAETQTLPYKQDTLEGEAKANTNKTIENPTKSISTDEVKSSTQEKTPHRRQSAHTNENFRSNVVNEGINHTTASNKAAAETLIKPDVQPSLKDDITTVINPTKCRDTDGKSAALLEEKNSTPPKPPNKTSPPNTLTKNENRQVKNSQVDDSVHIDSIAIRVLPVATEDNLRTAEKHVTAVPSDVVEANRHQQLASSVVEGKLHTLNNEDRTKDLPETSSQNLEVQRVLSSVRKLSDSLKNSSQPESINATSQNIQAENGNPERLNISMNSVVESKVQQTEEDYFQVHGLSETNHKSHSRANVGETSDAVSGRELPGLRSNKGVFSKESNNAGTNEVLVLDQSKTVNSRSVSVQEENLKRKEEDNLASKQTDGPTERQGTKNEKPEAGQGIHVRKQHLENKSSLSSKERHSPRNSNPTRESTVKEKPDVKPTPKPRASTIPEISALADYARLKVIVSEDRENTIQEFPPNKKEGFFPLIQSRHSRRPVFTADPQELSVKEKTLPNKTEAGSKVNTEPKPLAFPIREKEHQRTGMFKLGDKERPERTLLDAKASEGVSDSQVKHAQHIKERNKSPTHLKNEGIEEQVNNTQRARQVDQSVHQSNNTPLQPPTSSSALNRPRNTSLSQQVKPHDNTNPNERRKESASTAERIPYLDNNFHRKATSGQVNNIEENATTLRKVEKIEKVLAGAERSEKLRQERLATGHEDSKAKPQNRAKLLGEEHTRTEEKKRTEDSKIKHIIEESRASLAEEERRAAQREEERRAREREAIAQKIKERREKQREAEKKAEKERQDKERAARKEEEMRAKQREEQKRVKEIEEKRKLREAEERIKENEEGRRAKQQKEERAEQEEQLRRAAQEEEQRRAAEKERQRQAAQEEKQRRAALEEQQRRAAQEKELRRAAQEDKQRRAAKEEQQRILEQEEQQRKAVQEEQQRRAVQEEQQSAAQEEKQRRAAQEEQQRKAAQEEQQRIAAQEEQKRRAAQEEQQRRAAQEEQKRRAALIEEQRRAKQIEEMILSDIEEEKKRNWREQEKAAQISEKERIKEQRKVEQHIEEQRGGRQKKEARALEERQAALKEEKRAAQERILAQKEERESDKVAQRMEALQYYAITSTDNERKPRERQLGSPLPPQQRNNPSGLESTEDSGSHTRSYRPHAPASPAPSLPRSNTSSPALGAKPLMFRVKDNTFRGSSFTKSVKPRFHKNFGEDFRVGSPMERGSERGEEEQETMRRSAGTPVHPDTGLNRLAAIKEFSTFQPASSTLDYSAPLTQHRPYSRRSLALDEDDSRSIISNMSEDVESFATSAADLSELRGLYYDERPESACSFSSDVSRSLGKPPVVPPKSEKALRRAKRLTSRRINKELTKAGADIPAGVERPLQDISSNRPSSSTEVCSSNRHAVASPHFSPPVSLAHARTLGSSLPSFHTEHHSSHSSFHASPHATGPISLPVASPHATAPISLPVVSTHATGPASLSVAPKTVAHVPSSPTLHHANHPAPVTQYHVESSYPQSYPLTQRKVLQDLGSGQYFVVDVPVQVKTKTFFDPETGKYVQLNVRESAQSATRPQPKPQQTYLQPQLESQMQVKPQQQPLSQASPSGKPVVLYEGYPYPQGYQPAKNNSAPHHGSSAPVTPHQNEQPVRETQSYGYPAPESGQNSEGHRYSPEKTPYMDTVNDSGKTYNTVYNTHGPYESFPECDTNSQLAGSSVCENDNSAHSRCQPREIITISELEDFMEVSDW